MKRILWRLACMAWLWTLPAVSYSQGTPSVGKNVESLLQQMLDTQDRMQREIDDLRRRLDEKDRQIDALRSLLEERETGTPVAAGPAGSATGLLELFSARVQYEAARDLQHDVIFTKRKGEQTAGFERVIDEFRKVVSRSPHAPEADDAQIRIARAYHRYLDRVEEARIEYQRLLDLFPDSEYADEARKALAGLTPK